MSASPTFSHSHPINNEQCPSCRLAHPFTGIVLIGVLKYGLLALYRDPTRPNRFITHLTSLSSFSSHITHSPAVAYWLYSVSRNIAHSPCTPAVWSQHLARLTALWTYSISFPSRTSYLSTVPLPLSVWWLIPEELGVGEARNDGGKFSEGGWLTVLTSPDYTRQPIISTSLYQLLFPESTHHLPISCHLLLLLEFLFLFGFRDS